MSRPERPSPVSVKADNVYDDGYCRVEYVRPYFSGGLQVPFAHKAFLIVSHPARNCSRLVSTAELWQRGRVSYSLPGHYTLKVHPHRVCRQRVRYSVVIETGINRGNRLIATQGLENGSLQSLGTNSG